MADKIVILEDKDGNNIYPISRGVAANSIDTNAIQDGAVTSDKIDWATACEIVSNANGTAYKFGSGLMLCTIAKEVTTDAQYGIYQWNFPVAFTAFPVVSAPICRTSNYVVIAPSVDGGNATVANIKSNKLADGSVLTSATLPTFSAFAIGSWK